MEEGFDYDCDLCHRTLPVDELIGLSPCNDGWEDIMPTDANVHICQECLRSIANIFNSGEGV
jgi:hypothetical protein